MKALFHKYNGQLAAALILAIIVSASLQLVHDQLVDHQHGLDCPMFVVDGSTPAPAHQGDCAQTKQSYEALPFTPISLLLRTVEKQQARAPPVSL